MVALGKEWSPSLGREGGGLTGPCDSGEHGKGRLGLEAVWMTSRIHAIAPPARERLEADSRNDQPHPLSNSLRSNQFDTLESRELSRRVPLRRRGRPAGTLGKRGETFDSRLGVGTRP